MLKKVIPIVISLCLMLSVSAMAENNGAASDNNNSQSMQEMPMQGGKRPQGGQQGTPPQMPNGERVQSGNRSVQVPQGEFTPPQNIETNNNETTDPQPNRQFPDGMQGGFHGSMQNNNQQTEATEPMTFWRFVKTYSTPITSVILLALAFIFVIFYRRKNY